MEKMSNGDKETTVQTHKHVQGHWDLNALGMFSRVCQENKIQIYSFQEHTEGSKWYSGPDPVHQS